MKWLACFLVALLVPTVALAQAGTASSYTFTVPLQLENVPEANTVVVTCHVSRLPLGRDGRLVTGAVSVENEVALGEATLTITGGRYSGDVTVPTTWRMAGATGASYSCNYRLTGPRADGVTFSATNGDSYTRATGRRITSATTFAEGAIP